jgi:phosphoenolpyruvate carboxykinase (ATP)
VNAAIEGKLDSVKTTPHEVFGVHVPVECPGVPAELLDARGMWADKAAYDKSARDLAKKFEDNFKKFGEVAPEIRMAGPKAD